MTTHRTETGRVFHSKRHSVPSNTREHLCWYDVWATIEPKHTSQETLAIAWSRSFGSLWDGTSPFINIKDRYSNFENLRKNWILFCRVPHMMNT